MESCHRSEWGPHTLRKNSWASSNVVEVVEVEVVVVEEDGKRKWWWWHEDPREGHTMGNTR